MGIDIMKEVMNPEITIAGDKATVKGGTSSGSYHNRFVWDLVKDNEKWCIIKDDWWWRQYILKPVNMVYHRNKVCCNDKC